MKAIYKDLYCISSYVKPIDLSFNQYLLLTSSPTLIHTGNVEQAQTMLPHLKNMLQGKNLKYIFVSHFESDECGGCGEILKEFPEVEIVCSEVTARQFNGFNLPGNILIQKEGDKLKGDDFEFDFITYPSEMHLWDGLLLVENQRKVFFSSDLAMRRGPKGGETVYGNWEEETNNITHMQLPDTEKRRILQQKLHRMQIDFIAAGHGPGIVMKKDGCQYV